MPSDNALKLTAPLGGRDGNVGESRPSRARPSASSAPQLEPGVRETIVMPRTLLGAVAGAVLPLILAGGENGPRIPEGKPWVVLVHDSGLAGGRDAGLVFALWRDGTIVRERASESRSSGKVSIGKIDSRATKSIADAINASGLWDRPSAPRYFDLPEDGLLIRDRSITKCWFDTPPTAVTPGLRAVADAILKLQSGDPVPRTVVDDDWLPWSHYREAACH